MSKCATFIPYNHESDSRDNIIEIIEEVEEDQTVLTVSDSDEASTKELIEVALYSSDTDDLVVCEPENFGPEIKLLDDFETQTIELDCKSAGPSASAVEVNNQTPSASQPKAKTKPQIIMNDCSKTQDTSTFDILQIFKEDWDFGAELQTSSFTGDNVEDFPNQKAHSQSSKSTDGTSFESIDDWILESNKYEYLESFSANLHKHHNIGKTLNYLQKKSREVEFNFWDKVKPVPKQNHRKRRRHSRAPNHRKCYSQETESDEEIFRSLRKYVYAAKKNSKLWKFYWDQANARCDRKKFQYYLETKQKFDSLSNKFESNAILETLIMKNRDDITRKLDLHGLKRREALKVLQMALDALKEKVQRQKQPISYIVITGKGNHSKDGPVLRPAIEKFLIENKIQYQEIRTQGGFKLTLSN